MIFFAPIPYYSDNGGSPEKGESREETGEGLADTLANIYSSQPSWLKLGDAHLRAPVS